MDYFRMYIIFGLGFYLGLAMFARETFYKASVFSIIKGIILGIVLWPIGMIYLWIDEWVLPREKNDRP
jgi:uncharacterized membrane protein (DUF373 family)